MNNFLTDLSAHVEKAKIKINHWIDISNVFANIKYVAQIQCSTSESSTFLDITSDSHVEIIVLPTKRVGICIDSKYFLYSESFSIRILSDFRLYSINYKGVFQ